MGENRSIETVQEYLKYNSLPKSHEAWWFDINRLKMRKRSFSSVRWNR